MTRFPFLILCLFLLCPGIIIFIARPDLRRMILTMVACASPFALTEFFFYPDYWEPSFLFDLVRKIGFGVEDFLFVWGLGAFSCSVYPFVFRRRLAKLPENPNRLSRVNKIGLTIGGALVAATVSYLVGIPVIWSCVFIMYGIFVAISVSRKDLLMPGLIGGILTCVSYGAICSLLEFVVPNVFQLNWHADQFSNIHIAGIPLEELTYALGAGTVATVFYPFAFSHKFDKIIQRHKENNHGAHI